LFGDFYFSQEAVECATINVFFYGLIVMKLIGFFCDHFLLRRGDEEENWVWEKN
jgi:hypothetical protein